MMSEPAERCHLLMCCDPSYSQHLCVTLISLFCSNPCLEFDVVVVGRNSFGSSSDQLLASLKPFKNCTLRFVVFHAPSDLTLPVRAHYSIDNYSRLWLADFFPESVQRLLYLDCDVVVLRSIADLYTTDLGGHLLGAVSIPGSIRCELLGIPTHFGDFNSGVMLIDLRPWRDTNAASQLIQYIIANPEKLIDADQDAFNACFFERRMPLSYVWDVISPFYFEYHPLGIDPKTVEHVRQNACIVHFDGASKPWSYMGCHPHREDYFRFLHHSEWRDYAPPDRTISNILKKHIRNIMPEGMKRAIGN